jgi:hypothetical protein
MLSPLNAASGIARMTYAQAGKKRDASFTPFAQALDAAANSGESRRRSDEMFAAQMAERVEKARAEAKAAQNPLLAAAAPVDINDVPETPTPAYFKALLAAMDKGELTYAEVQEKLARLEPIWTATLPDAPYGGKMLPDGVVEMTDVTIYTRDGLPQMTLAEWASQHPEVEYDGPPPGHGLSDIPGVKWARYDDQPPFKVSRAWAMSYAPDWMNDLNPVDDQAAELTGFFQSLAWAKLSEHKEDPWHQTTEAKLQERLDEHWNDVIDDPRSGMDRSDVWFSERVKNPERSARLRDMMYERLRDDPEALDMMKELGMDDALRAIAAG